MKVLKSAIASIPSFDLALAQYAEQVRHWRGHMQRVEADKKNTKLQPIDRHVPYDRPRAAPILEQLVDEHGNIIAYSVEDDLIELQKAQLIARVSELEHRAIDALVPPGKRRMMALREARIRQEDEERRQGLLEQRRPGLIKKILGGGKDDDFDVEAAVAELRPNADTLHLAEQAQLRRRVMEIDEKSAQAMSDIEDLTVETIGSWKDPDFSGV